MLLRPCRTCSQGIDSNDCSHRDWTERLISSTSRSTLNGLAGEIVQLAADSLGCQRHAKSFESIFKNRESVCSWSSNSFIHRWPAVFGGRIRGECSIDSGGGVRSL